MHWLTAKTPGRILSIAAIKLFMMRVKLAESKLDWSFNVFELLHPWVQLGQTYE